MARSGPINAMATRSASAPLTSDLPISLIAKIESHRRKYGLKTASEVVRLAIDKFDFEGCKPERDPHRQVSVRLGANQRAMLQALREEEGRERRRAAPVRPRGPAGQEIQVPLTGFERTCRSPPARLGSSPLAFRAKASFSMDSPCSRCHPHPCQPLSTWARNISPSPTLAVDSKAKAMTAAGAERLQLRRRGARTLTRPSTSRTRASARSRRAGPSTSAPRGSRSYARRSPSRTARPTASRSRPARSS